MKSILILFIALFSVTSVLATEGSEGYIPSRLEWLAMDMNVSSKTETSEFGIFMAFVGSEKTNELIIYVRYLPETDRELLSVQINNAKELIKRKTENNGWTDWLKIKEDVKMQHR